MAAFTTADLRHAAARIAVAAEAVPRAYAVRREMEALFLTA